jgi:small multidrug resistance pump
VLYYCYLAIAIVAEVVATTALKASDSFTRLWPSMIVVSGYGLAFYFLSLCLQKISIGTAYAVWSGVGIILIALSGVFFYKQALDMAAVVGMALIVAGVLVLNLFSRSVVH